MAHDFESSDTANNQPLPSTEQEWRAFERQYGRWLKDNAYSITAEEGKLFKSATYSCFAVGVSAGVIVNLALSKARLITRPATRRIFSVFAGLYSSAICINHKRRPIYAKLLTSSGRLGNAARQILNTTKEPASTIPERVSPHLERLSLTTSPPSEEMSGDLYREREVPDMMQETRPPHTEL
ncbi:phosphatidylinositol glycan, class U [Babesia caballi]|uniref:Phosphatidylinositol glycan, class U n=1 Tax=Babesia caballi TaxID=5871 RepID=A0AAV4LNZ8_BABCB|nr:phosphatidylinositol glycan, class U [Babesia caballi]